MRLGQIARKLGVRPADIVEFLGQSQIEIRDGVNTRLEAAHVSIIMGQFAPASLDEPVHRPELELKSSEPTDQSAPDDASSLGAKIQADAVEPATGEDKKLEVIKAPKVELTGLKVLGKIELPGPKKINAADTLEGEDAADELERRMPARENKNDRDKKKYPQRAKKNPIADKREREARERQRKEDEQAAMEKERRTRYYQNRVKLSPPTKPVRLVDEPLEQMSAEELREPPKTWLGKMIHWLTNA